jgi:hypothetical protein
MVARIRSVGDLLSEHATACPWETVTASLFVPSAFDHGFVGDREAFDEAVEFLTAHAGEVGVRKLVG